MCKTATCRKCGKTTWAGCGMHVKQVMRGVPNAQRCTCASATQQSQPVATRKRGGFISLFRR